MARGGRLEMLAMMVTMWMMVKMIMVILKIRLLMKMMVTIVSDWPTSSV